MNVKYAGPARDYSGYGEANRHDIAALVAAGVNVTTQIPHYSMEISDYGHLGDLVSEREDQPLDYKIKIIHTTPNVYQQFFEPGKYHIGRVFWETDKLPDDFAKKVEMCDEIWTGSEFNKQAIIKAGVTKPIYIIPEAIDTELPEIRPYSTTDGGEFKFYSIFEWTERKNPKALLEAYWQAFQDIPDKVSLTLKTYVDNFTQEKAQEVKNDARRIKRETTFTGYAPVYFSIRLMDRHQIYRFHKSFDCFISSHRGEGWGIPQMEAMLMGNPIITTNLGGIHEYLKNGFDANLIPYYMTRVNGNSRNKQWYSSDQNWGEVNITELARVMRWVYDHQSEAKIIGENGRKTVEKLFSFETVGNLMLKRLEEISANNG